MKYLRIFFFFGRERKMAKRHIAQKLQYWTHTHLVENWTIKLRKKDDLLLLWLFLLIFHAAFTLRKVGNVCYATANSIKSLIRSPLRMHWIFRFGPPSLILINWRWYEFYGLFKINKSIFCYTYVYIVVYHAIQNTVCRCSA